MVCGDGWIPLIGQEDLCCSITDAIHLLVLFCLLLQMK